MFEKLKKGLAEYVASSDELIEFCGLSEEECRFLLHVADSGHFVIEGIQCNTSKEEDYFQCHIWNLFCEDYLFPLKGWYWKAFEHHLSCYTKEILKNDPEDTPIFEVSLAKEYADLEMAETLNELVEKLKADPSYTPKSFDCAKKVIGLEVE